MSEDELVGLAYFHLEGDAQQFWILKLERDHPNLTWELFKQHYHMRFGPPLQSNKLGELSKLRQTGTVQEYQRQFEQLSARASSLTGEQEVIMKKQSKSQDEKQKLITICLSVSANEAKGTRSNSKDGRRLQKKERNLRIQPEKRGKIKSCRGTYTEETFKTSEKKQRKKQKKSKLNEGGDEHQNEQSSEEDGDSNNDET